MLNQSKSKMTKTLKSETSLKARTNLKKSKRQSMNGKESTLKRLSGYEKRTISMMKTTLTSTKAFLGNPTLQ